MQIGKGKNTIRAAKVKSFSKNIIVYFLAVAIALASFFMMNQELNKYKRSVDVAVLKDNSTGKIITADELEKRTIAYQDYLEGMILWNEIEDKLVNKYPTVDIWKGYPILAEMVTEEPELKYEYLYELPKDEEILTIRYDFNSAAGNIPKPGDRFRIRGTYTVTDPATGNTEQTSDVLFSSATVIDMLNSTGNSIYQIIADYNKLPPEKKKEAESSGDLNDLVIPAAMMIAVPENTMDKFSEFSARESVVLTFTLLTRDPNVKFAEMGSSIFDTILNSEASGESNVAK